MLPNIEKTEVNILATKQFLKFVENQRGCFIFGGGFKVDLTGTSEINFKHSPLWSFFEKLFFDNFLWTIHWPKFFVSDAATDQMQHIQDAIDSRAHIHVEITMKLKFFQLHKGECLKLILLVPVRSTLTPPPTWKMLGRFEGGVFKGVEATFFETRFWHHNLMWDMKNAYKHLFGRSKGAVLPTWCYCFPRVEKLKSTH